MKTIPPHPPITKFFLVLFSFLLISCSNLPPEGLKRLFPSRRSQETPRQETFIFKEQVAASNVLMNKVRNNVTGQTEIHDLQKHTSNIRAEIEQLQSLVNELERKAIQNIQEAGFLNRNRSNPYHDEIQHIKAQIQILSDLDATIQEAIVFQRTHTQRLQQISFDILNDINGLNALYNDVSPFTNTIQTNIRPVRNTIGIVENPVIRILGYNVTALSLLQAVDPASGRVITDVRDLCDLLLYISNEVEKLGEAIKPMRAAASQFSNRSNRVEAVVVYTQAQIMSDYLNDKRNLFNPVTNRINTTRSQINTINSLISYVNNRNARNMLSNFSESTSSLLNVIEQPIQIWENNMDAARHQFDLIIGYENDYNSIIKKIKQS